MTPTLGRYELLEKLGEGGMGAVWLGRLRGEGGFEKLCIIKTVLPAIAKDQQFVSRFLHEGRVLTALQHSNIAQVFDMGREAETLYLALEYVPGVDLSSLSQHLRNQQQAFPLPVAVSLIQQVAEGLGFAHRKNATDGSPLFIVHRDVSPQNVMISFEGEVKVIDFGIAKSEGRSHATASASVMGKLGYMAPEQARGESVDARADQYSCAVLLWEMLASTSFVPRGTMTEMVVAMANPPVRPLALLRPEVPASLEHVVLKALSARREDRFETTDDLAAALTAELLKLSFMPTKRQIGEWVRQNCPAEVQANHALMTRIASQPTVTGDASTFVRTPATSPMQVKQVAAPNLSTAEVQQMAMPKSKTPVVVAALAVAVLSMGAFIAFMTVVRPAQAVGQKVEVKKVFEVFDDGQQVFLRAGADQGVKAGESYALVGEDQGGSRRPLLGAVTVLEVFKDMSRVNVGSVETRPLFVPQQDVLDGANEDVANTNAANTKAANTQTSASPGVAPQAAAALKVVTMVGRITAPPSPKLLLVSRAPHALTNCEISLSRGRLARVARIEPNVDTEIPFGKFASDPRAVSVDAQSAHVVCQEAEAKVNLR